MLRKSLIPTLLCVAAVLSACNQDGEGESAAAGGGGRPPASVGVVDVTPRDLRIVSELPGRINPTRIAEVRPRVGGIIEERVFEQGTSVEAGDVLFRIDPATYEVAVEAARAGVARAEATLLDAQQSERRTETLQGRNVVSSAELDRAIAARKQAEAELAAAKAELRSAEINLGYTNVTAPIGGRVGRAETTEGALVSAGGAEVLTTIQALDPVYADIQQPVSELLRMRGALERGELVELEPGVAEVLLYLDDGSRYPEKGRLLFSEVTVERTSGQVTLRAEFANPKNILLPGMYVRVAVEQATQRDALTVPSQAIQRDATGAAKVYVVETREPAPAPSAAAEPAAEPAAGEAAAAETETAAAEESDGSWRSGGRGNRSSDAPPEEAAEPAPEPQPAAAPAPQGPQTVAVLKPVTLGRRVGNQIVVMDGLKAGDRVIADGVQKIGPGAPVSPVPWTDPSAPTVDAAAAPQTDSQTDATQPSATQPSATEASATDAGGADAGGAGSDDTAAPASGTTAGEAGDNGTGEADDGPLEAASATQPTDATATN